MHRLLWLLWLILQAKKFLKCDWLRKVVFIFRKKDGSDYEPDSLRVMIASLDRHLKEAGSNMSIAKDKEFVNSRKVLEGKARLPL